MLFKKGKKTTLHHLFLDKNTQQTRNRGNAKGHPGDADTKHLNRHSSKEEI